MQIIDSLRHFPDLITRDQTASSIGKEKEFFFLIQTNYIGRIDEKRAMALQERGSCLKTSSKLAVNSSLSVLV